MFTFRPTYEPLVKLCKELINEKKVLMEENEGLKEMLESTKNDLFHARAQNRCLGERLADLQNEKRKDLEKRVADLEEQLAKKVFLLDDEGEPIKSFTLTGKLTLMDEPEPTEEKLKVGKWYHTTDFSLEKLKELLPVGTKVEVEVHLQCCDEVTEPPDVTMVSEVKKVVEGNETDKVYISVDKVFYREWFKIIKE